MGGLVEPDNLREKILLIADAGAGKTTAWLSIAWWAFHSGDTRKFYCVDPQTPVLSGDLRWRPAQDFHPGDEIIGVDEMPVYSERPCDSMGRQRPDGRRWRNGIVTHRSERIARKVRITLEDGRKLVSSDDHRWLRRNKTGRPLLWVEAKDIQPGHVLKAPLQVWPSDRTDELAWLAGILDGEGCWSQNAGALTITQKPGRVWDKVVEVLEAHGFEFRVYKHPNECNKAIISSLGDAIRLIGWSRPERFVDDQRWVGRSIKSRLKSNDLKVIAVEDIGYGSVISLATTNKTFIANGVVAHNCLDTDDEAVLQVMNEDKYAGMVHSFNGEIHNEGGNVIIYSAYQWDEYQRFSDYSMYRDGNCVINQAQKHDWIILDFVTHSWTAAQEGFLHDAANKTRGQVLHEAGVSGATGWDMFKTEFNWNAINGSYYDFIKPILIMSRAHVFMCSEIEVIDERKATGDLREHLAQFSKFKFVGQKKLAVQCRSYLRTQRLARGRVLYTNGKDRARPEFDGDIITPDFFSFYLKGAAKWQVEG